MSHSSSNIQTATTTATWSHPQTQEQITYFSKHAAERDMYGWAATIMQLIHGAVDFIAIRALIGRGLSRFLGEESFIISILACAIIFVLHSVMRVSWETYWYDKLDEKEETDSSVFPTLITACLLIAMGFLGARQVMHQTINAPAMLSDSTYDNTARATMASNEAKSKSVASEIAAAYDASAKAVKAKYNAQIKQYTSRKQTTDADRAYVRKMVAPLERNRDTEVAAIQAEKAEKLTALATGRMASDMSATARKDTILTKIAALNAAELRRVEEEKAMVNKFSAGFAFVLIVIVLFILYKRVRINVKSGIMPQRNFTKLQQHGGVWSHIGTAIGDGISRQGYALGTALHRLISPRGITELDDRLYLKEGNYQAPRGGSSTGAVNLSSAGVSNSAATYPPDLVAEVLAKMQQQNRALTAEQLESELRAAQAERDLRAAQAATAAAGKS